MAFFLPPFSTILGLNKINEIKIELEKNKNKNKNKNDIKFENIFINKKKSSHIRITLFY